MDESMQHIQVVSQDGQRGIARLPAPETESQSTIRILLEDGRQVLAPVELLRLQEDGSYLLVADLGEIQEQNTQLGMDRSPATVVVVPVAQEELRVLKQTTSTGGVRVTKRVTEEESLVDEPGYREDVEVERVQVNRVLESPESPRYEGDTLVVPLMEEIVVVEKRLVLKEELRITRRRTEVRNPQRVTLRREEASIEQIPEDSAPSKTP